MKKATDSKRFTRAVWYVSAVALGLTALAGAHEVAKPHQEWITINLPNPPAPLPDSAAPVTISSDLN